MRLAAALLCLLAILFVPGCNFLDDEEGVIVLRYANWGGATEEDEFQRTLRKLFRQFEQENPGVRIKEERIPGSKDYVNKMLLSFVAGTEPEIMALDASSAAVFINNGVLMDLRPFIDKDPEFSLDDYYENVVRIAQRDNQIFAIPGDFTPMVMYYNMDLFDAAGVPYPADNWTFDDFLDKAQRLTNRQTGKWGFKIDNWMPGWIMFLWNNGADVLSPDGTVANGFINSERSREAVKFLTDLIYEHRVAPSQSETAATGVNPFMNGDAAMQVSGHWGITEVRNAPKLNINRIGVVPLPTNLEKSVTVMYEVGYAVGRNCKHPEMAWKFVKFLTSKRYQEVYNQTGIAISARKDVSGAMAEGSALERKFLEIVPSAREPWGALVDGYDYVETVGPKMMDNLWFGARLGEGITDQAVTRATNEAARRIDEYFRIR